MKNRAIFLDRDGTLNEDSRDYIKNLAEFRLFRETLPALKMLHAAGYLLIIITNQSALARGLITEAELRRIHTYLKGEVQKAAAEITDIYICPHHPDENCDCRKPKIANVLRAVEEHDIDCQRSYFIGDSIKDIQTGQRAGCHTVLVETGIRQYRDGELRQKEVHPDCRCRDILAAAEYIMQPKRTDTSDFPDNHLA